jgi:hypothetical protein
MESLLRLKSLAPSEATPQFASHRLRFVFLRSADSTSMDGLGTEKQAKTRLLLKKLSCLNKAGLGSVQLQVR